MSPYARAIYYFFSATGNDVAVAGKSSKKGRGTAKQKAIYNCGVIMPNRGGSRARVKFSISNCAGGRM